MSQSGWWLVFFSVLAAALVLGSIVGMIRYPN